MKYILFIYTLLLLSATSLFSQDYTVSGTVNDSEGAPIEFANVYLLDPDYTTLLKGTTTDENGSFRLTGVAKGRYFLKASYLATESEPILLEPRSDMDTLKIVLDNSQQLDEVVVIKQKPRLERQVDRIVFNVENTALADGNIWDVLKRTPNLIIIDDKLTIKGTGSVGILINGRKVNIPEKDVINLLSGTSASNVESVEVITNPPAKYSAEGGMLVNIVLKKNLIAGYNGAVYNKYRQGVFPRHTLGTDHYFRGNKTSFSVNYSFGRNKSIDRFTDNTTFLENDGSSRWVAEQKIVRRQRQHNVSAFFDYDINKNNRLSLSTINLLQPRLDSENDSETLIGDANGVTQSSFVTNNRSEAEQLNTAIYMDFVHTLKMGGELSFNSNFTYYDTKRPQLIETDFFNLNGGLTAENDFISNADQRINLFTVQVDYSTALNDKFSFETGVRYADINSASTVTQEGFNPDLSDLNPTERGNFSYDEAISAAYVALKNRGKLWRINTGLRAEYTKTVGDLDTEPETNERNYLELFPSFSVQYLPSKKHNYKLYYYRRITRPRYNSVNPFQIFLTNNAVVEGEPNLLQATRNYVAAGYTYDKAYTVELFYRNEKNPFRSFLQQDNERNIFITKTANFDRNINYGIDLTFSKQPTRFWDCYVLASYYSVQYDFVDSATSQNIVNRRGVSKLSTYNTFTLLNDKTLYCDVDFNYYSDIPIGNAVQESYNQLDIGLRKTLWNKKASVSVGLLDIFNQGNRFSVRQYANQNNTSLFRPENRLFTFGFRYKFGNTGIKTNKKSKRTDEGNRL